MEHINWKQMEEDLKNNPLPIKELVEELVKLRKLRSDFVDFCGWILTHTQFCKYNSELKENFLNDLNTEIDDIFEKITEK